MFRRVNFARLEAIRGNLQIAMPDDIPRLEDIPAPSVNGDLSKDETRHEKV